MLERIRRFLRLSESLKRLGYRGVGFEINEQWASDLCDSMHPKKVNPCPTSINFKVSRIIYDHTGEFEIETDILEVNKDGYYYIHPNEEVHI